MLLEFIHHIHLALDHYFDWLGWWWCWLSTGYEGAVKPNPGWLGDFGGMKCYSCLVGMCHNPLLNHF